ncbi:hypothetical protein BKA70DRAFT_1261809 [Coprinopsis sp. MPI-PUGE-AT-0042]|nr:hypothetical protein BKA70DRAFT_1261809 [Coprinopsis sp. MPI-PUGE-AT-0042]
MLLDLPEDVVIALCERLQPQDLLALQQTCRGLHAIGTADYLWHRLDINVPVDLPVNRHDVPGRSIQQCAVRALRLEKNWRRNESNVRRLTRIRHVGTVVQLQLIGPSFIAILSRSVGLNLVTELTVWRIGNSGSPKFPSRITSIELPHTNDAKFAASYSNQEAIFVVAVEDSRIKQSHLRVFTVSLHEAENTLDSNSPVPRTIFSETRSHYGEIFFDVQISGSIVVAGLAKRGEDIASPMTYELLMIDIETGSSSYVGLPVQGLSRIQLKLYDGLLYTIGVPSGVATMALVISIHTLPREIRSNTPDDTFLPSFATYRIGNFPSNFEFYISKEPAVHSSPPLPIVVFYESPSILNRGTIASFAIPHDVKPTKNPEAQTLSPLWTFEIPSGSYPDILCVGESGQRLLWLERKWEAEEEDYYRIMKAAFNTESGLSATRVWPNYVALPFQPPTCRAMYLEECTGRMCFALHTEEIYVAEL